jgi:hypothetical protein
MHWTKCEGKKLFFKLMKDFKKNYYYSFRLVAYIQSASGAPALDLTSFPAAAKLQQLLNTPQAQLEQCAAAGSSSNNNN